MHWIYILKCQNNSIYVGETTRLFRRFVEHQKGTRGKTTSFFKPKYLIGIYKLENDGLTFHDKINKDMFEKGYIKENKGWGLMLEDEITLMIMKAMNDNWEDVYGGKYCINYKRRDIAPLKKSAESEINPSKDIIFYRPYCKCKIPADIYEYNDKKYWRCCKKNYFDSLIDFLEEKELVNYQYIEPCDFYKKYIEREEFKCEKYIHFDLKVLIKNSPWIKKILNTKDADHKICVYCDCPINKKNGMFYGQKLLCITCFKEKNEELRKIFSE